MRVGLLIDLPEQPDPTTEEVEAVVESKKRRGATAMEYLVMASFVLCALIIGAQQVGLITGKLMKSNADKTTFDHIHKSGEETEDE